MKNSLIALALLSASGAAFAESSVTLYGVVDPYFGNTKATGPAFSAAQSGVGQTVVNSGGLLSTSFWGLKGSEDLGGGLQANFLLEAGFNLDTGASPGNGQASPVMFSRQSWVGFSGGFGALKIGKMLTPYDEVKGSGAAAFDANIFAPATNVWASNGHNDRPGNAIYYSTPGLSGFSAAAMYSFGENRSTTQSAGNVASVNLAYAGGPVAAALSRQTEKLGGNLGAGLPATQFTQLNASYNFGAVKLLGAYGRVKDGLSPIRSIRLAKSSEYQIGLDFPVSSVITLSAGYAHAKDTQLAGGSDIARKGYALAGLYALSRRTDLYAGLQQARESDTGSGENRIRTYAAGLRHMF